MKKFALYRLVGETDTALARQYNVTFFPTVLLLKPSGDEFHRWKGMYTTPIGLANELEKVLLEAGPIPKAQLAKRIPSTQKTSAEIAPSTS
jgi:hypothetical protein